MPPRSQGARGSGAAPERAAPLPASDDPGPRCPDCGGVLTLYPEPNPNPHKLGQAHCPACGERKPLPDQEA